MGLLIIGLAGVLGTTAMIGVMSWIHHLKLANADMVRAIGTLFTKSNDLSRFYGLVVNYSFGIFFAFVYAFLMGLSPVLTPGSAVIITLLTGLVHGLMVGLMLIVAVGEFHPMKKFRNVGVPVALAHVVGHVVYGLTIGSTFALTWARVYPVLVDMASGRIFGDIIGFAVIWFPLFGIPMIFVGYMIYAFAAPDRYTETEKAPRSIVRKKSGSTRGKVKSKSSLKRAA